MGASIYSGCAQSFVNLDFEDSVITTSQPAWWFAGNTGAADVPGWTEYSGYGDNIYSGGSTLIYNNQTLDDSCVALFDTAYPLPAVQGNYSIFLYGGSIYADNPRAGAAIGQTGQIPLGTKSITYWGTVDFNVTFDGQLLSFSAVSSKPNHTVYQADISAYAGQIGQLLFTAPWPNYQGLLDNIQFSASPIPEPTSFGLFGLAGLLMTFRLWRRHSPKGIKDS